MYTTVELNENQSSIGDSIICLKVLQEKIMKIQSKKGKKKFFFILTKKFDINVFKI
jgi:hypothetical protein